MRAVSAAHEDPRGRIGEWHDGVPVTVVNESVKKTDRHDAATLEGILEKNMLPVARLRSPESEELRRILKTRTALVRSIMSVKIQLHGRLTSLGVTSDAAS